MDVDNGQCDGSGGGVMDIEQSLLQQFSCMGTTDKEELVQQLQKVLGSQINEPSAAFFLDMNNWNLQAAICSYFDIEFQITLPLVSIISDPRVSDSDNIEPYVKFSRTWHLSNVGSEAWPSGCSLKCTIGNNFGALPQNIQSLKPGEGADIIIEMISPEPGLYQSRWRLCTPSDPLWVMLTVIDKRTMELTQQLSHLSDLGSSNQDIVPGNPFIQTRTQETLQDGSTADQDLSMC